MSRRRRDRERRPPRRRASRQARRRLLVVCEGERTEPEYIKGFERQVRNHLVTVEVSKERGDPRKVVEIAKALMHDAKREARRSHDTWLEFDEVWCVFDRDEHERYDAAVNMAQDNNLELAVSNPSFELWLVLHFRESPGPQHRDTLRRMLRDRLLPGYDKGIDFEALAEGIEVAIERTRRLDEDAAAMGEPRRNPTTGVYRLTDSIAREDEA